MLNYYFGGYQRDTDIACKPFHVENKELDTLISRAINGNPVMSDRIMFGSDMPVVLLNVES